MHRFNYPRLAAGLVIALVVFVACSQGPGASAPREPDDDAPVAGCSADAETWRGLKVCAERPRDGYDRDDYGTGYSSLEDDIIAALPPTMKQAGQVYTPYSCIAFDITPSGTAKTDIEHIVALAEAHDGGIADDRRRAGRRECEGCSRMEAVPARCVVRTAGDRGEAGIRADRRSG